MQEIAQKMLAIEHANIMSIFFKPFPTQDRVESKLKMSYMCAKAQFELKVIFQDGPKNTSKMALPGAHWDRVTSSKRPIGF